MGLNTGTASEGLNQASQTALNTRVNNSNANNQFGSNVQTGISLYDTFNKPTPPAPAPMPAPPAQYQPQQQYGAYGTPDWKPQQY